MTPYAPPNHDSHCCTLLPPPSLTAGFGYFFPVLCIGGLGTLGYVGLCAINHSNSTNTIYGYAIGRHHVVEASGELGMSTQKAVDVQPITTIERLGVAGTSIAFWNGSTHTTIKHQRSTAQLYQYLQRCGAGEQVSPAGAGGERAMVGVTTPPPSSLDASGNPMKQGSVVPVQ